MNHFIRCLKAEFIKLRRTPIVWMYIIIPMIGLLTFTFYYSFSLMTENQKSILYFEALSIMFPLLIGVICGMATAMEEQAGNCYVLLSAQLRSTSYLAKLTSLVILASLAVTLSLGGFVIVCDYVLKFKSISLLIFLKIGCFLVGGNILIYAIHLLISFLFGKSTSIGLGLMGSLISMLMNTGLGDMSWKYLPYGWTIRFCDYTTAIAINKQPSDSLGFYKTDTISGLVIMTIASLILIPVNIGILSKWQGKKLVE